MRLGVGFDIDHTIAIDNKLERVAFMHLLADVVDAGGRMLGTMAQESDSIDALLERQRGGAFTIDEAVLHFVAERGAAPDQRFAERFRSLALDMVEAFVVPLPGVRETVAALRELGVATAILSNGWNPLQQRKAQLAGWSGGSVIASGDLSARKPDPRAFAALLGALGTSPESTWYVGDDPRGDVEGALRAGLRAVWLDNEGKHYPGDAARPTAVISSLQEIVTLVSRHCLEDSNS
jgi:HAD superfamily hydrolase (TIGR01509 family)